MADVIELLDGSVHTIMSERDALELIDAHMGTEMRRWLEEWAAERDGDADYIDDLEKEAEGLRAHHREVMEQLRQQSETIAGLIREKDIDRKALSAAVGVIGCLTWRELR